MMADKRDQVLDEDSLVSGITASETTTNHFYVVKGKVQRVMFRQTLIRAAHGRGLVAGATNLKAHKDTVKVTLQGDGEQIKELVALVRSGMLLNSWGAKATSVTRVKRGIDLSDHQVTTANVDSIKWKSGVTFHLH
eukprot:m.219468 g.219468  ORF g.219468 m.219468 type:complete len:136 (-) comp15113_c0_seq1:3777-4184(-)